MTEDTVLTKRTKEHQKCNLEEDQSTTTNLKFKISIRDNFGNFESTKE